MQSSDVSPCSSLSHPVLFGLHIVDDNFLQPQAGTSAADHLVSGLVPLALVAAAALSAYPRVRAGARALALLLGYFGVLVGTEAAYYTLAGGCSGDDYTGLVSLAIGFLLLGACTVMLWRSRRAATTPSFADTCGAR